MHGFVGSTTGGEINSSIVRGTSEKRVPGRFGRRRCRRETRGGEGVTRSLNGLFAVRLLRVSMTVYITFRGLFTSRFEEGRLERRRNENDTAGGQLCRGLGGCDGIDFETTTRAWPSTLAETFSRNVIALRIHRTNSGCLAHGSDRIIVENWSLTP